MLTANVNSLMKMKFWKCIHAFSLLSDKRSSDGQKFNGQTPAAAFAFLLALLLALIASNVDARQNADPSPPGTRPAKIEKIAYLGVTTKSVDAALAAQLKLPEDTGLTVTTIDRKGPATKDLLANDVLQKLDDQILIDSHQLATLIHMHRPGDAVTLSIIRQARPMQVTIKLGEKERAAAVGGNAERSAVTPVNVPDDEQSTPFDPNAPLPRGNQTAMNFSDDTYSANVKADSQGRRHMIVKDLAGQVVASGPVDTEEQWMKFKPEIRQHLEMVHKMLVPQMLAPH